MNESRKSSGFWMNSSIKSRFSSICDEFDNTDYIEEFSEKSRITVKFDHSRKK